MINPFKPEIAVITEVFKETSDTTTYTFRFKDEETRETWSFEPGQFNMITVFGIGEAPISISSAPSDTGFFQHTVRHVGNVTNALAKKKPGDVVGIRGAYGTGWPFHQLYGRNVLIVAGGIGLAPLRPVIREVMRQRDRFKEVEVLYGARTPGDMLFVREFPEWSEYVKLRLTVDTVPPGVKWDHKVGVVTTLFSEMSSQPSNTVVLTCGPEIMMKFVVRGLLHMGFSPDRIYVSMERRMHCGVGKCGRCQIGPRFTCKDGPVFAYEELAALPEEVLGGVGR